MAVNITKIVWEMALPHTEKMVLLCLADYADKFGEKAFPSVASLCGRLDVTRRTVQKSLSSLRLRGLIRIVQAANSYHRMTNEYAFDIAALTAFPKVADIHDEDRHRDEALDTREGRSQQHGGASVTAPQPPSIHQAEQEGELTTFALLGDDGRITESDHQRRQQELADQDGLIIGEGVKIPKGVPVVEMVRVYNRGLADRADGLPRCVMVNRDRANKLSARFKDCGKSLEGWAMVLRDKVAPSRFLMGHAQARAGQEPFKASLDWIIGPQNFVKIVEGNYVRQVTDYRNVQ